MRGSFESRLRRTLSSVLEKTPKLDEVPRDNSKAPQIVNLVSTVHLLPQTKAEGSRKQLYRLPLDAIARKLSGCSQFAPQQFAANILRLTDSTSDTTSLIFRSGKIVTVSGLSIAHTRYFSQVFRTIIERVQTMVKDSETGRVYTTTLEGRTSFDTPSVHNVVGSGFLGVKVDLPKLREAAGHCCRYEPETFPGLMFKVWITPSRKCECSMAIKKEPLDAPATAVDQEERAAEQIIDLKAKCVCVVKCLIFDSGELVITGGRDVQVVYKVFDRIKQLVGRFEDKEDKDVPRENRFNHRLARLMIRLQDGPSDSPAEESASSNKDKPKRKRRVVKQKTLTEEQAVAAIMVGMRDFKPSHKVKRNKKKAKMARDPTITPLMKLAAEGRLKQLEMLMSMEPAQLQAKDSEGNTVLDRMLATPRSERTPHHTTIVALLRPHFD